MGKINKILFQHTYIWGNVLKNKVINIKVKRKATSGRREKRENLRVFVVLRFFRWHSGKEHACQGRRLRRCRFNTWVRKIPWRRKWQPLPSIFAWRMPWTEEPGRLQYIGSHRVRHGWARVHARMHFVILYLLGWVGCIQMLGFVFLKCQKHV